MRWVNSPQPMCFDRHHLFYSAAFAARSQCQPPRKRARPIAGIDICSTPGAIGGLDGILVVCAAGVLDERPPEDIDGVVLLAVEFKGRPCVQALRDPAFGG